jgi:N-acetylglucosamine kinase-like BadF-type ATPase
MLKSQSISGTANNSSEQKQAALRYILDAWEEAVYDGIDPDNLATAAIFAALSDMVAAYGEDPVATLTEGLSERIRYGEFTINRTTQ